MKAKFLTAVQKALLESLTKLGKRELSELFELNSNLELDHPDFIATFLAVIPQVEDAATAVFNKDCKGEDPMYKSDDG
ncbi:MAG: hypothetical protein M1816_001415 [Peltula sp. TS41687]|nr:MAG: hypothetical protein M1816_001415 [Peltula sp. TS41687]